MIFRGKHRMVFRIFPNMLMFISNTSSENAFVNILFSSTHIVAHPKLSTLDTHKTHVLCDSDVIDLQIRIQTSGERKKKFFAVRTRCEKQVLQARFRQGSYERFVRATFQLLNLIPGDRTVRFYKRYFRRF